MSNAVRMERGLTNRVVGGERGSKFKSWWFGVLRGRMLTVLRLIPSIECWCWYWRWICEEGEMLASTWLSSVMLRLSNVVVLVLVFWKNFVSGKDREFT